MRSRLLILLALTIICVSGAAHPAAAQTPPPAGWPDRNHLVGLVSDVVGPAGNPTSFVVQLGTMAAEVGTMPKTRFVARSLEAQVEKFVAGDYAVVTTRRTKLGLIAARIVYDVEPFAPLRALSGMILWVSPDQVRFRLRLDPTRVLVLRIRPQTRFEVNGRVTDTIPTLGRGQTVQVLALQHTGLDAYEIDLTRTGYTLARGSQ